MKLVCPACNLKTSAIFDTYVSGDKTCPHCDGSLDTVGSYYKKAGRAQAGELHADDQLPDDLRPDETSA
jgi:hypothetical protein